jgi:hypothetical protein
MPQAKPIVHIETCIPSGQCIDGSQEITLSENQLNWMAGLFAPMVKAKLDYGAKSQTLGI